MDRSPGKSRKSLLTLLNTTVTQQDVADTTRTTNPMGLRNITHKRPVQQRQQLQPSPPSDGIPLSVALEPLEVTTNNNNNDEAPCPLATHNPAIAATIPVAGRNSTPTRILANPKAASAANLDNRFDPLPLYKVGDDSVTTQQAPNLYYDSFGPQQQRQPQHRPAQQFPANRPTARLELGPQQPPVVGNSNNPNREAQLMIEPTPVWPNAAATAPNNTMKPRESRIPSLSDNNRNERSNAKQQPPPAIPPPIHQRFHPVEEEYVPESEKGSEDPKWLRKSPTLEVLKQLRHLKPPPPTAAAIPVTTAQRTNRHESSSSPAGGDKPQDDEGIADSFQGRSFYPPEQQPLPPLADPEEQTQPREDGTAFFHFREPPQDRQSSPIQQPLDTTPTSYVFAQAKAFKRQRTEEASSPQQAPPRTKTSKRKRTGDEPPKSTWRKPRPSPSRKKKAATESPTAFASANTTPGRKSQLDVAPTEFPEAPYRAAKASKEKGTGPSPVAAATTLARPFAPKGEGLRTSSLPVGGGGSIFGGDNYIRRIHDMLEEANLEGFDHVVSWQPHGRAFKVHDAKEFSNKILPRYFHTQKIVSFRRWLRAWGFETHSEGSDRGAFYHRYFVRGVILSLVKQLTREEMQKSMEGWLTPGELPNFYDQDSGSSNHKIRSGDNFKAPGDKRNAEEDNKGHSNASTEHKDSGEPAPGNSEGGGNKTEELDRVTDPKMLRGTLLENLRQLLQDARNQKFENIVCWLPGGKAFKIHNNAEFQKSVCGKYFNTQKIHSFSDSLRTWGFCRLWHSSGVTGGAYYHSLFQDGKPELCRHLSRKQMNLAMKEFREEQKRQKEIAWSLFPRHLVEVERPNSRNGNPAKPSSTSDDNPEGASAEKQVDLDSGKDAEKSIKDILHRACPLAAMEPTTETNSHPLSRGQNHSISFPDLQNTATIAANPNTNGVHDGSNNNNNDDPAMDSSIRDSYAADNFGIDPCYPLMPPGTMDNDESAFPPSIVNSKRPRALTESEATHLQMYERYTKFLPDGTPKERETSLSYVTRIHLMLEGVERNGDQHIVSWRSHGRAFKIHDERAFESRILPRYFVANSLASFTRWLNHWGFLRIVAGKDRKCWYHRLFVRGTTELLKDASRDQLFEAMNEWRGPGIKEPDFYCSGRGDELSEHPSVMLRKKTKLWRERNTTHGHEYAARGGCGGPFANATTASPGKEARIVSQQVLRQQKDPKYLRGTMVENLRDMLDAVREEGQTDVASWMVHGRAFKIHKPKVFEETILHRFFKAKKYRYFGDVLRSWGFVIFKNGRDKGAFYHKFFVRDEPKWTLHLSRTQMKASMKDWSPKSEVPDFYEELQPADDNRRDDASSVPNPQQQHPRETIKSKTKAKTKGKATKTTKNRRLSLGKSSTLAASMV